MELQQLENLIQIARSESLSEVAKDGHISQSALSRSLQKLEGEMGVRLFDRTGNSIALNDAGRLALRYAELVCDDVARLEAAMRDWRERTSTVRIGSTPNRSR